MFQFQLTVALRCCFLDIAFLSIDRLLRLLHGSVRGGNGFICHKYKTTALVLLFVDGQFEGLDIAVLTEVNSDFFFTRFGRKTSTEYLNEIRKLSSDCAKKPTVRGTENIFHLK